MDDAEILERANALLAEARADVGSDREVELLVLLLHRTAVELNKAARAHATASKGAPDWGAWAGLQNTTRGLVLQASTCRDILRKLSDRGTGTGDAENSVTPG